MAKLAIDGRKRLTGEVCIQGAKNTALPVIGASLLADCGVTVIKNCPDILDVRELLGIMEGIGCRYEFSQNELHIYKDKINGVPDFYKCRNLRASIVLMGALLSCIKYFVLPYPGGCKIGRRPIDFHIDGLRKMGAVIEECDDEILGYCRGLYGTDYTFPYPSVGALENLLLSAVCAEGISIFRGCATEPEIVDLCDFLNRMGAKITGAGTGEIVVRGVKKLKACTYTIPGDRIVAGTYMTACGIAGGNIKLKNIIPKRVEQIGEILKKTGCHVFTDGERNEIIVLADGRRKAVPCIITSPWPGFPTDMQSQIMGLSTYFDGSTRIVDNVFEGRYATAFELGKMGAEILVDENGVTVQGKERLYGADVEARDLRGGAALVIAALGAQGITTVEHCEYIMRGYEDIQRDLEQLGASISWL